ncbi:hypothetical protein BH10BAC3_BH10BAC3_28880 [soil metagenome]
MKTYFTLILLLAINAGFGQVTNVKPGNWSDPTVWSNNKIPTDTTNIILSYNIQVDISANCKSIKTNKFQVYVGTAINFYIAGLAAPVANFTFSGPTVVPTTITFTNTSTYATSYLWDFGDTASGVNNTSTALNPTHFYKTLAPYPYSTLVKLIATGSGGKDSISRDLGLTCVPTIVEVGASIDTPTTWDRCHIYHCSKFVGVNAPLTINGATVTFDAQKGMIVSGSGKITAKGAIFTSSATSKKRGDWAYISFGTTSGNSIEGSAIQYAGYASLNQERALNMGSGANNSINRVVFEYNAGTLNQITAALDMSRCPISSTATNNLFFANSGHPVLIGIATNFDNSNEFSFNDCDAIFVDCVHVTQASSISWTNKNAPFVLGGWSSNSWAFGSNKILTLGDSVVIKFARYTNPGFSIFLPSGISQIQNFGGLGVVFTSYQDDTYLGDSNGDGAPLVSPSLWEGVQVPGPLWVHWTNMFYSEH